MHILAAMPCWLNAGSNCTNEIAMQKLRFHVARDPRACMRHPQGIPEHCSHVNEGEGWHCMQRSAANLDESAVGQRAPPAPDTSSAWTGWKDRMERAAGIPGHVHRRMWPLPRLLQQSPGPRPARMHKYGFDSAGCSSPGVATHAPLHMHPATGIKNGVRRSVHCQGTPVTAARCSLSGACQPHTAPRTTSAVHADAINRHRTVACLWVCIKVARGLHRRYDHAFILPLCHDARSRLVA